MWHKLIRSTGIFLIITFSALCVFLSITQRDLGGDSSLSWWTMPSFFEDRFFDMRMNWTLDANKVDKDIVLAKIDDQSLKEIGRWPWSRSTWAQVIDRLGHLGAKVVAFDVFFSEPEIACQGTSPDQLLAESINRFQADGTKKIILPYSLNTQGTEFFQELPESLYNFLLETKQQQDLNLNQTYVSKTVWPVPQLIDASPILGHIEAEADVDGVFRHIPIVANVDGLYLPSFALATFHAYSGKTTQFEFLNLSDPKLILENAKIPVNMRGEVKVRWLGNERNFSSVSIRELLDQSKSDEELRKIVEGKLVFVASTSYGAHDLRNTPVDSMLPGIFMHMNIAHMLLNEYFYRPADQSTQYSWMILISLTLAILIIQLFHHAILDLFSVMVLVGGAIILDITYFIPNGHEVSLFFCLFSVIACYMWTTFINFYLTNKDKAFLKSAFGNYISPELIDQMHKRGEAPKLGGDVGIRTAFFTDIQGFSTFSEKLTAVQLVELLNEYLTAMTDILLEEGGTLDKYEGDAIIAFFGAPMPLPDHAIRACTVANRMQKKLEQLRAKWKSEGEKWPVIVHDMRMRIGINSGEIVTGNMGSKSRMNYTMMGDSVNLAARLEEAAKQYGIFTHITHFTEQLTEKQFLLRELDTIRVVGKSEPVTTYDLLDDAETTDQILIELKKLFELGLESYKKQDWDQAISYFNQSLNWEEKRFPGLSHKPNPSKIYLERCLQFKQLPPPPDWDGVYVLTHK